MALAFLANRFTINPTKDDPAQAEFQFNPLPGTPVTALVAISGFKFQYSTSDLDNRKIDDHHLGVAHIETAVHFEGNVPNLLVQAFLLRDGTPSDETIDDFYEGFVDVQMLVEYD